MTANYVRGSETRSVINREQRMIPARGLTAIHTFLTFRLIYTLKAYINVLPETGENGIKVTTTI